MGLAKIYFEGLESIQLCIKCMKNVILTNCFLNFLAQMSQVEYFGYFSNIYDKKFTG